MSGLKKEEIMQELDKIAREVGKRDRLALLLEYFDEAIRHYSSLGFTPRGITTMINKLLKSKHEKDKSIPQFVREADVVKAMRILGIRPARGKQKLKPADSQQIQDKAQDKEEALKNPSQQETPQETKSGQELPQETHISQEQSQNQDTQNKLPQDTQSQRRFPQEFQRKPYFPQESREFRF